MRRSPFFLQLAAIVLAAAAPLLAPRTLTAATDGGHGALHDADDRDRILTERFRHRQAQLRRAQRAVAALSVEPVTLVREDAGNIGIIDDSGAVVTEPNTFDLEGRSLIITPSGVNYSLTAGAAAFEQQAVENGVPVELGDDDARAVFLPFAFPFFGQTYTQVFVNSDGNLTFGDSDARSSSRTLSRAVSGPPRIAPLFADLDPSQPDATVTAYNAGDRFLITWDNVPEFSFFGSGQRQTFQVALYPGGRLDFQFASITLNDSVVGLMPGRLQGEPFPADLSQGVVTPVADGVAEIFSSTRELDIFAVGQRFYLNHEDAYDFLVLFNSTGLPVGGTAFAFEVNVRNETLGVGDILTGQPVFDFGLDFGSPRRLQSFMNMGPLSNYPENVDQQIPLVGENTTLTVLTHEAGHRFLAYVTFLDPTVGFASDDLLGRGGSHWSFFFHSDASVLEGNRIADQGMMSPRFRTTAAVSQFSGLDQYLMGLRAPEEVGATFVVDSPQNFQPSPKFRGSAPQTGVAFDGERQEVTVEMIVAAEGPRAPDWTVSQKEFRFAFILLVPEGEQPSQADLAKLEEFRTQWQSFFSVATDDRATALTDLVKMLHLSTWPAGGVVQGLPGRATVEIGDPLGVDFNVLLTAGNGGITVPALVTIPAGERSVEFSLIGNSPGVVPLTAHTNAPGFDTARTLVQVRANAGALAVEVESGDEQGGALGGDLPEPVVLRVRDSNLAPYSGIPLDLGVTGDGQATPARPTTDESGRAEIAWRLATNANLNTLTASIESAPPNGATALAVALGPPPAFTAAGVVNAASFNTGPSAENTALAPGGLVSIFGAGLALETRTATCCPLPTTLGATTVTMNGVPAPLLYVSPDQLNLQVPFEITGSTVQIMILTAAGSTGLVSLGLDRTQPGVFIDFATGLGAIINVDDGTRIWERPARAGTRVAVFCTGLGEVDPPGGSGLRAPVSPLSVTLEAVQVLIDGEKATVEFSGLAPFFAGLYQVNVLLPADLPAGRHTLVVRIDNRSSNEVFLDVE